MAAPDYLRRRKRPERIDDLREHACLRMRRSNGSIAPWPFIEGNKTVEVIVSGPLVAHDYPTLLGAAIQGLGLAQVPGPLAKAAIAEGRLHALLTPFAVTTPGVFLYHPGRRQVRSCPSCARSLNTSNTKAPMYGAREQRRGDCASSTVQTAFDLEAASCRSSRSISNYRLHSLANDPLWYATLISSTQQHSRSLPRCCFELS